MASLCNKLVGKSGFAMETFGFALFRDFVD